MQTFTYDGKLQCAPKDYSTLALVINTDLWAKAGLTDADIPKDWAGLEAVAKKLTKGKVTGLVIGNDINRGGAFMVQAGGWVVNKDGKKVTADTPREPGRPRRDQEDDGGRVAEVHDRHQARPPAGAARRSARARPR